MNICTEGCACVGPVLVTLSLVFRAVCVCVERCPVFVTLTLVFRAVCVWRGVLYL